MSAGADDNASRLVLGALRAKDLLATDEQRAPFEWRLGDAKKSALCVEFCKACPDIEGDILEFSLKWMCSSVASHESGAAGPFDKTSALRKLTKLLAAIDALDDRTASIVSNDLPIVRAHVADFIEVIRTTRIHSPFRYSRIYELAEIWYMATGKSPTWSGNDRGDLSPFQRCLRILISDAEARSDIALKTIRAWRAARIPTIDRAERELRLRTSNLIMQLPLEISHRVARSMLEIAEEWIEATEALAPSVEAKLRSELRGLRRAIDKLDAFGAGAIAEESVPNPALRLVAALYRSG